MKYQAYPEYKDSGVEWIDRIPRSWKVKRTKAMFALSRKLVGKKSKDYQLLSLTLKGIVPRDISDGGGKIPAEFDTYQVVNHKDLIFCLFDIDETPRTIGISYNFGMITGAYNVYTCSNECFPEYAYYYFMHIDSFKGLKPFYTGLRKVVRSETFGNIKIPCPSFEEQKQIAAFLDRETAKIDTLIDKQKKLIALLKEKRQATISHAVTKGLNPTNSYGTNLNSGSAVGPKGEGMDGPNNALMKDSGIPWLGKIPAHWEVKKLKHLVKEPLMYGANEAALDIDTNQPRFIRITDVLSNGDLKPDTFRSLPNEVAEPYMLLKGDVLLARSGGTVGKSFIYKDSWGQCCFAGYLIKASINPSLALAEWLYQYTQTQYYWEWIGSNQIQATIQNVSADKYNGFIMAVPPLNEQKTILTYLNQTGDKFESLVLKAERAIKLMKERRTALISAAVTGKIDVRAEG